MSDTLRYAGWGLALVACAAAALWPWLEPGGRRGVLLAAGVAWPIQVVAFGLLVRRRGETEGFLIAWAGGIIVRMAVVVGAGLLLARVESAAPAPTLLALAGFFFGLLLLEPVFFRPETSTRQ